MHWLIGIWLIAGSLERRRRVVFQTHGQITNVEGTNTLTLSDTIIRDSTSVRGRVLIMKLGCSGCKEESCNHLIPSNNLSFPISSSKNNILPSWRTSLYDYYASINRNKKGLEGGYYSFIVWHLAGASGCSDPPARWKLSSSFSWSLELSPAPLKVKMG